MLMCSCCYYYQQSQSVSQFWFSPPHSSRINYIFSHQNIHPA